MPTAEWRGPGGRKGGRRWELPSLTKEKTEQVSERSLRDLHQKVPGRGRGRAGAEDPHTQQEEQVPDEINPKKCVRHIVITLL